MGRRTKSPERPKGRAAGTVAMVSLGCRTPHSWVFHPPLCPGLDPRARHSHFAPVSLPPRYTLYKQVSVAFCCTVSKLGDGRWGTQRAAGGASAAVRRYGPFLALSAGLFGCLAAPTAAPEAMGYSYRSVRNNAIGTPNVAEMGYGLGWVSRPVSAGLAAGSPVPPGIQPCSHPTCGLPLPF